jgi:hypothetical protein
MGGVAAFILHCCVIDADRLARQHLADIQQRQRELRRMAQELERTIGACAAGAGR